MRNEKGVARLGEGWNECRPRLAQGTNEGTSWTCAQIGRLQSIREGEKKAKVVTSARQSGVDRVLRRLEKSEMSLQKSCNR